MECSICHDALGTNGPVVALRRCQHLFCTLCLHQAAAAGTTGCPLCRTQYNSTDLVLVTEQVQSPPGVPTKMEKTVELITKDPSSRYLVFSCYDNSFNELEAMLSTREIPSLG